MKTSQDIMNGRTTDMEHIQVEGVRGGERGGGMGIMGVQKEGWISRETKPLVNRPRIPVGKLRLKWNINTRRKW